MSPYLAIESPTAGVQREDFVAGNDASVALDDQNIADRAALDSELHYAPLELETEVYGQVSSSQLLALALGLGSWLSAFGFQLSGRSLRLALLLLCSATSRNAEWGTLHRGLGAANHSSLSGRLGR